MLLQQFDFWALLAGLGIFLFGIFLMEDSIKEVAGRSFKQLVRRYTNTSAKAVLTGISITSLLQSSSAIMLMILAFVGAGIMTLQNAIGVIFGANIGTTVTAWIVAVFGFKISIESFALPIIALGGLGMIFFPGRPRFYGFCRLLLGFGFLFHGLAYMKEGVEQLTTQFDVASIAEMGTWVFVLAGLLLTALMQSSSATIAIVLTAISSEVIGFRAGAAMVIGANIGTTVTVLLGAVGGVPIKKRVAYSHLIFNGITAILALILLPVLIWIIQSWLDWQQQPILGIALFHTLFNVAGLLLFLPFINRMAVLVTRLFPEEEHMFTHYIQNTSFEITDAALEAFRKEILHQYKESRNYLVRLYELKACAPLQHTSPSPEDQIFKGSIADFYRRLKQLHGEIFEYYSQILSTELQAEYSKLLDQYLRSSRSIMNASKNLKDLRNELQRYELAESALLGGAYSIFQQRLQSLIQLLDSLFEAPGIAGDRAKNTLEEAFLMVEEEDTAFIRRSSEAIREGELPDVEATTTLMLNRLFTQSFRMIILSLRELLVQNGKSHDLSAVGNDKLSSRDYPLSDDAYL